MTRFQWRSAATLPAVLLFLAAVPASGQYFGRNKVQYKNFAWRILRSDHFDNFFYPPESLIVHDAARMAERWYTRHSETFRHAFDRKSLIFYADHPDFEQTNVVGEELSEGTGGVTEGLRTRVIMPFTGVYADNDHVLGHELVHVFQYNIAEAAPGGGLVRLNALPLWLIEGMAEYFSLGRDDELTAMWMRDAVQRKKFPTIKQLTNDPRFFPYRYGQALWAYVGGRWGDRAIVDVYRAALRLGWDQSLVRVLGENSDSLSKDWAAANIALYAPILAERTNPDSAGDRVLAINHKNGDMNLAPTLSPDGKLFAFFGRRGLFTIDLYIADAKTGRVIKKLAGPSSDPHFDAISFINSAGDWSPDGSKFAFIVYAEGNNQIAILDTRTTDIERRIKVPNVGAISQVSWSPDGRTLAFSGQSGGISDLYLLDLQAGTVRQLTHDRFADIQPSWSPDGKTLAFVTDRGPGTDFETMKFSPLKLATMDVATGQISLFAPFSRGKAINPQFSPDGRDLFFVSDQDGISDVYRLDLASGQVFRITRLATGVSGITAISPAISVSRTTGRLLFDVFQQQGNAVYGLDSSRTRGVAVSTATPNSMAASMLPPGDAGGRSIVTAYLNEPVNGLASGADFRIVPYHPSFSLDALGQPSVGVATGPFGTGVAGGVSAFFGDQLSDQQIATVIQANGTVRDIGGAVFYTNLRRRWNYSVGVEHIPYLTGGVFLSDTTVGGTSGYNVNQVLERIYVDQAQFTAQYPFSTTRRVEFDATLTRLGYGYEIFKTVVAGNQIVGQTDQQLSGDSVPRPLYYASPTLALVGDNAFAAFTSPIDGGRYRLEYSPTVGNINFQTVLADYRRYLFMRPVTLAFRGVHYGRYGKDSDNGRLAPLFLGEEQLIRGYGYGSFDPAECGQSQNSCPVFDRLFGSRMAVANVELRIPVLGTSEFGLLNIPFLPTELSPFFDAGLSYTGNQRPDFRFTRDVNAQAANCTASAPSRTLNSFPLPCADRIPVFSTGLSARVNFLGYLIFEAYIAHPFQRPTKNWVTGFQLAPGW